MTTSEGDTVANQRPTSTRLRPRQASLAAALEAEDRKEAPRPPLSHRHQRGSLITLTLLTTATLFVLGLGYGGSTSWLILAFVIAGATVGALSWYQRALGLPQRRTPQGLLFFATFAAVMLAPQFLLRPLAAGAPELWVYGAGCLILAGLIIGPAHMALRYSFPTSESQAWHSEHSSRWSTSEVRREPEPGMSE